MTRWFILTRVRAKSRFLATMAMRRRLEADGYRVLVVRCHEIHIPGEWEGAVEIKEPGREVIILVRAKFKVSQIAKTMYGHHTIHLVPVTGDSPENKEFFKWTPGGQIELNCVNDAATEQFEVGKEYYVDFTKAE
jgi:hypothetical protein